MLKLRFNPVAKQDLLDIKDYIANELDNPTSANKVVSEVIESYRKLKEFPKLGPELTSKIDVPTDYRYLISGNHIIFYKIEDVYVSIYRILDTRQDYIKILFGEEKY
ncbi:MAG: type II toxin-antitoxin system RelE/ParE family toxin [Firmicutes bacterium]|nr:type II toxin-antitoxin system RelE/ParE family toxin [Bacillota bacterium]